MIGRLAIEFLAMASLEAIAIFAKRIASLIVLSSWYATPNVVIVTTVDPGDPGVSVLIITHHFLITTCLIISKHINEIQILNKKHEMKG